MENIYPQNPARAIKQWPENERPRERLIRHGAEALSDAQLLAILLRTGIEKENALALAMKVIEHFGGLVPFSQASIVELCKIPGIGKAKAAHLRAALELGRRVISSPLHSGARIRASRDIYRHYHPHLRDLKHEMFKVILLDRRNRIIRDATISEGSLTSSIVHPREAFNPAIRDSAGAVIFIHNHPSGDPSPSREDQELTKRLVSCGDLLGVKVLDHLIVGDGSYYSFADQGCLV